MAETADYEVMIEGKTCPLNKDTISVSDIRKLGDIPPDGQETRQTGQLPATVTHLKPED
jgi:hypothetical protein